MHDQPKPKPEFRRCRALTVNGRMCHQRAMRGESFCVGHRHRNPVCPQKGGKVSVPLLEDISAIQLVASQVAHGLFTETLDPWRAGKILYACQVAAMTVPRPARVKTEPVEDDGAVTEPFTDLNGELLGPDQPWIGNGGSFEPIWSSDKMHYEHECERLGKPKPTCPADMPPEGWVTPEEQAEQKDSDAYNFWMLKLLERRVQEDQLGHLPPPEERKCSYDWGDCRGPIVKRWQTPCPYCGWELEAHERIVRGEEDPLPPKARRAIARSRGLSSAPPLPPDAPGKSSSGSSGHGDSVFIDDPEETEVLDSHKVTLLNMHHCADDVGTLPPLEQRTCFYTMPDCAGPASPTPCTYCRRERDYYRKLHKDDNDLNLNASAAQERQQSGCPMSRAVRDMGQRASARFLAAAGSDWSVGNNNARAACKKSDHARVSAPPCCRRPSAQFRRNAADPRPCCQLCQHRQTPHSTRSPQPTAVPGRPLNPKPTPLRYPVGNTPYGSSPGISLRSLRNHHQPAQRVVDHSVRRRAAQRSAVEHRSGQCFRRAALLRRIARAGVHQPLVRFRLHSGEAGFHRRPLRAGLNRRSFGSRPEPLRRATARGGFGELAQDDKSWLSAPGRASSGRRSCAGCPADSRCAARRAARTPGIPASTPGARSAGWRGCPPR